MSPAFLFLHYWGRGRAEDLAQGQAFRKTLDAQRDVGKDSMARHGG